MGRGKCNLFFQKYGEALFKNCVNWEEALETFAEICSKENIDMVVHVSDLEKIKNYMMENNKKRILWILELQI